ncbi:MAG TPA: HNH endonuclease signature motif containing protein [Candidatus Saccharibacteria bacterium]|nr:HNH endonuclease signature motif containing protein [Candidatus Saccharibacteria bacterium]
MSSSLTPKITNIVWGQFNGRCARCDILLSRTMDDGTSATIGKIAHIVGENEGSARFTTELSLSKRNSPDNLMLLCGTHHDEIDNYHSEYSVEDLHKIKNDFLKRLSSIFQENLLNIGFAELDVTISYLVQGTTTKYDGTLKLIPPAEKIAKNELSSDVEDLLRMGLVREDQLEDYLNKNLDSSFSSRLRNIIVEKYNSVKAAGLSPDEIFYEMLSFSSGGSNDFKRQAAGLTVIAYYFNVCDIFEK